MFFHPDKCNVLRVNKKRTPLTSTYKLKGQELAELSTSKYLGVDLSSNLDWKEHIDRTVKKASSVLGFLRRNLLIINRETKSSAYVTLVRPHLEYCASIWSPHTDQSKQKLEMVQRRSARYCTNRYHNTSSVTDMPKGSKLIDTRVAKDQTPACYDIQDHEDLVDIPADTYLTPATTRTRAIHSKKLRQYPTRTDTFKYSLFPRTIPVLNSLPA